jgi:hypothetical protein
MAMQEMEIAIAALVRTYDFRLAENCHVKEVLEITLKPMYVLLLPVDATALYPSLTPLVSLCVVIIYGLAVEC